MSDSTHTITVRAFDSAYPGSMFDKPHGEYVERGDASSLAAALLELVSKHKRDAEDFEDALKQEKAERDALRAEVERLRADAIKSERRAIEYSDIIQHHVIVMRAAVVASSLYDSGEGMLWIKNTLLGPGHYPNIESARELGGAQALFDKEMAEHEAFRAAHPLPAIPAALKGGA